jgi:hypothetical protein
LNYSIFYLAIGRAKQMAMDPEKEKRNPKYENTGA